MSQTIIMAQLNLIVGDLAGNAQRILDAAQHAKDEHNADLIIFPELTLTGYPPEDLLLRPSFIHEVQKQLDKLCEAAVSGIAILLGYPRSIDGNLYNAAGLIVDGKITTEYFKQALPNYSVFDEKRYFSKGTEAAVFSLNGTKFGLTICEDIWQDEPIKMAVVAGAQIVLNLNASPFDMNKSQQREELLAKQAVKHDVIIFYVNLVGGQDELVFDGGSMIMNQLGEVTHKALSFVEEFIPVEIEKTTIVKSASLPALPLLESIYQTLVLGIRDYVQKNGFSGAILGLSGGIDSALVLALAVEALGAEQVEVVLMPSRYTSDMSNEDAAEQAKNQNVRYTSLPIEQPFNAFLNLLEDEFEGLEADVTEENIQARCRGILLMAMSNKKRKILLTTGNKSEMSVGYATLYGDMAGGFAPIKDCPKLLVYQLAEFCNRNKEIIPRRVIDRPPSAELRPDQKDTDSLPDYSILDEILRLYVEEDADLNDIVSQGFDVDIVRRIIRLVDINEHKRRQAPPGVKITQRAYGRDRRYPMTNKFRSDML